MYGSERGELQNDNKKYNLSIRTNTYRIIRFIFVFSRHKNLFISALTLRCDRNLRVIARFIKRCKHDRNLPPRSSFGPHGTFWASGTFGAWGTIWEYRKSHVSSYLSRYDWIALFHFIFTLCFVLHYSLLPPKLMFRPKSRLVYFFSNAFLFCSAEL